MHYSGNGRSRMRKLLTTKLIVTVALLVLTGGPVAIAQSGGTAKLPTANPAAPPPQEAPIGHRQPRADQEHLPRLLNRAEWIRPCGQQAPRRPSMRRRTRD